MLNAQNQLSSAQVVKLGAQEVISNAQDGTLSAQERVGETWSYLDET
ncbi:hypothetical protein [Lysinibacillus endophyticus]|nr:hypothetical protein [Lysinibacillus endophyticus]MCP1144407.1 hypothetical protein [Lysinibacillus endophyticus]